MPLTRKYAKDKTVCSVTFSMDAQEAGNPRKLFLAGDFNGWDPVALPMRKRQGRFSATVTLAAGAQHQYRYVTDQGVWLNDTAADCYVHCVHAQADNSVVAL